MIRFNAFYSIVLAGLASLSLVAACNEPTPTGAPAISATDFQPAALATAPETASSTATAFPTPTNTPTGTPTLAAPATLTISETLNIRSGPGITYPVVGVLLAEDAATVIGVSPDGKWWKLACPTNVVSDQCWVISDPQYSAIDAADAAIAIAIAPAAPSPTLTPAATPCIASAPPGWSAYRVRSGDTLSGLAQRTGAFVAELQSVNCLDSDVIVEGSTLSVPGGPAVQPGIAGPGSNASSSAQDGVWLDLGSRNEELVKLLGFSSPGGGPYCRALPNAASPSIRIGAANAGAESAQGTTWEVGQVFGICLNGVQSSNPLTLTIQPPSGEAMRFTLPGARPVLRWIVGPGEPRGLYRVTSAEASASFEVIKPTDTKTSIAMFNRTPSTYQVSEGQGASFVAAGYKPGPLTMYVCRADAPMLGVEVCFTLRNIIVGANRSGRWNFSTKGLDAGTYVLHDGIDPEFIKAEEDPRLFVVTGP
ncbi:LysM peptidoglycan-binding domain-containing protein [Caldilinea sp.]|uniref:LysM peptidoglycan-binding domain-containing protein n=1 Tax=Caldilinea sp. TaxID=2293560 RepID=UPI002CF908E5|nr:SH3 domain-containing protein [Caldilinea sp.]